MAEIYHQQPPQPPRPPLPPPRKKGLRPIVIVGIVVASLIWLVSCSAIVGALGGTDTTVTAPTTSAPAPAEEATTTEAEAEPTEEPEPEPTNCKKLKKSQLKDIAAGTEASTTVRAKSGVLVPLSDDYQFGFNQIVALKLTNGSVATFATENLGKEDHGLLIAVNGPARKHFVWGAAVRPGSPMDDDLQDVKNSLEYDEAVGCASA
jgi:hypothetical protein